MKRSIEELLQPRAATASKPRQRAKKLKEEVRVVEEKVEAPLPKVESVMPLISVEDGSYVVNEEAAAWIEQLPGPFGILSTCGKSRTGKSFFLNRVLLQKNPTDTSGFGVGATIQAHTKGLWMSTHLLDYKGQPILVIDTEGISALDTTSTHDTKIFCLALLLSSYFIYNSVGSIDEEALNTLSLVVKVAEQIRRADRNLPSADGVFPSFLWLVRDFALRLRDASNNPISEAQYLEDALKETGDASSDKNKIRKCLKDFFAQRTCATLVRPCEDESQLQDLDTTPNSGLREVFVQQITKLRADILERVKPKTACGQPLTGKLFVQMCRSFTEAINKGAAPSIKNTWSLLSQGQCIEAMDTAMSVYRTKIVFSSLPVQQDTLTDVFRLAREVANAEYQIKAFGDELPLYASKLQDAMDVEEAAVRDKNKAALTRLISSNFEALTLGVENASSFEKFKKQYDTARDHFLGKYPGYEGTWAEAACDFVWTAASSYINQSQRRILKELEDASLAAAAARRESHGTTEELRELRATNVSLTASCAEASSKLQGVTAQLEAKEEALRSSEDRTQQLQELVVQVEAEGARKLQEHQEAASKQLEDLQANVREQMEAACTRASTLEGNVLDLELRLSEAERQLEQQRDETELHLGNCRRLEGEVEAAQLLSQQNEDLQAEKESLEETVEELQTELDNTIEKAEEEQRQFRETALQTMEEMKAAQAAERETFKAKVAKLSKSHESALEDVRSKLAIAEQQVSLVEKQVLRKNEELQGLQEQVVQLGKDKDRLAAVIKELESRHVDALAQSEKQYQQGIQSLRQEVTGLRDANTRECLTLMESVRAAESRAVLAEARLRDSSKQLENARNSDGPKIAGLQTSVNSLTTQLQRAQAEVAHLKENKEDMNRRLKEAAASIKTLTARCKDLGVQTEKEIASVKLTYERRISVLEQRLSEFL